MLHWARPSSSILLLPWLFAACGDDSGGATTTEASTSTSAAMDTSSSGAPATTTAVDSTGTSADGTSTSSSGGNDSGTSESSGTGGGTGACDGVELQTADFIPCVAQAHCDALFRCCDDSLSLEAYFSQYVAAPGFERFIPLLPPMAEVTEEACPGLLEDLLTVRPFGRWLEAVDQGLVDYDGVAAQECLDTLNATTCDLVRGETFSEVSQALFDGTCLGFGAPLGGEEQRRMFSRDATDGQACITLNDGAGGGIFGTCDPTQAFCCIEGDTPGGCVLMSDSMGTCASASGVGEPCFLDFPGDDAQFCQTGLECTDFVGGDCFAPPPLVELGPGDQCFDGVMFFLLGECPNGTWCDLFGTESCEPQLSDGEPCNSGEQCLGGGCNEGICGNDLFCTDAG